MMILLPQNILVAAKERLTFSVSINEIVKIWFQLEFWFHKKIDVRKQGRI